MQYLFTIYWVSDFFTHMMLTVIESTTKLALLTIPATSGHSHIDIKRKYSGDYVIHKHYMKCNHDYNYFDTAFTDEAVKKDVHSSCS